MELIYRGTRYSSASTTIEAMDLGMTGKYRGVAMQISTPSVRLQRSVPLTYRGVSYSQP